MEEFNCWCAEPPHCGHIPHCAEPPCKETNFNWTEPEDISVGFISVWGTECGIATYNFELVNELKNYSNIHVFSEYNNEEEDSKLVTSCWDRTELSKKALIKELKKRAPDIVHISHEYGFFPKSSQFTNLVSEIHKLGIPIVSTLHSVYSHLDKTVQEASVDHIIVHTSSAKACLIKKGIDKNKISVIPHGISILEGTEDDPKLLSPLWNTWGSDHTIFQPGFLFPYKGHLRMLDIINQLKDKYPDVHYIVQGSESLYNKNTHESLYKQLSEKCDSLGLGENVTINRGFISQDSLLSFVRTSKCCVLPYLTNKEHDVRATSGIARLILGTETPLVVSDVHLFDDIIDIVPHCSTDNEIYDEIVNIFDNPEARKEQIKVRSSFLRKNCWSRIAFLVSKVYEKVLGL